MSEAIWESKTVDSAINLAIKDLGCKKEDVDIEVIQEPVKGIFGIQKMARVKVFVKDKSDKKESLSYYVKDGDINKEDTKGSDKEIRLFLENILKLMGFKKFEISCKEEENNVIFNISCEYEGLLIGKYGKTLESIQYLLNQMVNKNYNEKNQKYLVDVGNYLKRHRDHLENIALNAAKKAKETKEEQQLSAMNAYDRKIIHLLLKDDPEISTYSVGEGIFRHVTIAIKNKI